jgi:HAD superfamily hydrolase (TIGR01549 family)
MSSRSDRNGAPADGDPIEMVFLDIGGVMYSDQRYQESLRKALRELGGRFSDEEFDAEYRACRRDQEGSFRRRLTDRFLGDVSRSKEVEQAASKHWWYQPEDLYPDVKPALEQLSGSYRLGVLANQPSVVRTALERDGVDRYFDVWGVSDDLGLSKPDPRLFEHALLAAGSEARSTAMVGDRFDYDMVPARSAGMHTVWVLRGEAPDEPTEEQLAIPDVAIRTLTELSKALESL